MESWLAWKDVMCGAAVPVVPLEPEDEPELEVDAALDELEIDAPDELDAELEPECEPDEPELALLDAVASKPPSAT